MNLNTTDLVAEILQPEGRTAINKIAKRGPYRRAGQRRLCVISAKVDSGLLSAVNAVAERRGVTRSSLIEGVLHERMKELLRGAAQ